MCFGVLGAAIFWRWDNEATAESSVDVSCDES